MPNDTIRFIDLFGGIGGFRLGLEYCDRSTKQDGEENQYLSDIAKRQEKQSDTFNCVWYCDNDKYAVQTYNKNFKENYEPTDIRTVDAKNIPNHDMLCAGFPCQSFSIAGKRQGFQDTRGTLFYEICRIAQAKRPRLLFLENVKGLLSADDGRCFSTIISSLLQLGYSIEWQMLNSKNFGVPQNRERVFIIGHLGENGCRQVFPLRESYGLSKESRRQGKIKNQLSTAITQNLKRGVHSGGETLIYEGAILSDSNKKWLEDGKQLSRNFPQGQRVYSTDGIASNICGEAGGLGGKTGLYQINPTVRSGGRGSLERHKWDVIKSDKQIRRLTPVECERLQGFPDNWTEGVSDTQRYKQLGNAVTVNVIKTIGEKLN